MFAKLPQLNSIRVFEAAARLMSFKAASIELNVTPTAVSHQIRNLENKLGTLLFERKTRSITLTAEGQQLAQVAHQSLQQIASTLESISRLQTVLTVSTTASFAALWLVPRLESFHQHYPEIQAVIRTGEQLDDLQNDKRIDLVIRYGQFSKQYENATKLVTERFAAYATKAYLSNICDLENATLIETQWKNRRLPSISWKHWLKRYAAKIDAPKIRHYDQEHHVIQAALAGQGIALASAVLTQTALEQGWLQTYKEDCHLPGLTYYLLLPTHSKNLRKVEAFRAWLIEKFSTHNENNLTRL